MAAVAAPMVVVGTPVPVLVAGAEASVVVAGAPAGVGSVCMKLVILRSWEMTSQKMLA